MDVSLLQLWHRSGWVTNQYRPAFKAISTFHGRPHPRSHASPRVFAVSALSLALRTNTGTGYSNLLRSMSASGRKSRDYWGSNWEPGFFLPSWTDSIEFSSPCSYHHSLALVRYHTLGLFTRSIKTTLLAAACELKT